MNKIITISSALLTAAAVKAQTQMCIRDSYYCVGLLTADANANLLDPASWKKHPTPVFQQEMCIRDRNKGY